MLDDGSSFRLGIAVTFKSWTLGSTTFGWTTESAAIAFGSAWRASTSSTRTAGATLTWATASAHGLTHARHAFSKLGLRHGAAAVFVEALEALLDLLLRKRFVLSSIYAAVTIGVHAAEDLVRIHSTRAARTPGTTGTIWRTATRRTFAVRTATLRLLTVRASFTWRATESAFSRWSTVWTTATRHAAHFFGDLTDLSLVDETVAIGVHACKTLVRVATRNTAELFLAQLAVCIRIRLLQELEDATSAISAWAAGPFGTIAALGAHEARCEQQDTGTVVNWIL